MPHLHHGAVGSSWVGVVLSLALVYTALAYLRGWRHLRSTSSNVIAGWRAASFLIGLLLIWIAVASPVAAVDHAMADRPHDPTPAAHDARSASDLAGGACADRCCMVCRSGWCG